MMKVYVPKTRKEIERKLRKWGITRIRGTPLRELSRDELTHAYCREYRRIYREKQALDASRRRLPF
jgi:hypothetical protein